MWQSLVRSPIFPYFAPFFLFGVFLYLESLHPLAVYAVYPIKAFAVGVMILWLWRRLPSFEIRAWRGSVIVGVIGFILWVVLDHLLIQHDPAKGFNPYIFGEGSMAWGLIAFRLMGAVLVVPIMEEIFWRGFLMRYIIQENFETVALGTYRPISFAITTVAFASVHGNQWFLALVVGLLFGGWFLKTKTLGDVIIAHAVTNLILGIYVIQTQKWFFW
jgi:uncharacterized protein